MGGNWRNYCNSNPVTYIDPDGCIDLYFGWIENGQAGWNDTAIQTKAGYHNWMDPASSVIFNIDHAEVDMGDFTMRFWKGDYASTYRAGLKVSGILTDNPLTKICSNIVGMAGGETGLYNNDGKGLGFDGGSLMSQEVMSNIGIIGVQLKVNKQDETTIVEVNDGKLRAWPNGYNLLDNSRKGDLYTETTYLFDSEARANEFINEFQTNLDESDYENQFRSSVDKNEVTITWDKKNE